MKKVYYGVFFMPKLVNSYLFSNKQTPLLSDRVHKMVNA